MTKYIRYKDEFLDINDSPVSIPDPDTKKHRAARDAAFALNRNRENPLPAPEVQWDAPSLEDASYSQIVCWFANGIPYGDPPKQGEPPLKSTPEDTAAAIKVIRSFRAHQNSHVAIEEEALTWLKNLTKEHGSRVFRGTLSALITERLEDELPAKEVAAIEEAGST